MSNPFDFDNDKAAKDFEKNTIYGNSPYDTEESISDFMKKSYVAANMVSSYEETRLRADSLKASATGPDRFTAHYDNRSKAAESRVADLKKNSYGVTMSARGQTNPATRPLSSEVPRKDTRMGSIALEPGDTTAIDDVVQHKPQISAVDYNRLQEELASAKKMIETLKHNKWSSIPVGETMKRIVTGKPYTLDGYKAIGDKKSLLETAVKCSDGNAIITVVLFLERTLSTRIFRRELRKFKTAIHHYVQHLRKNQEWLELEEFYKYLQLTEDAALLRYEQVNKITDIKERIVGLHKWLNNYGDKLELDELKSYISDEMKMLEKQRQLEDDDKIKEVINPAVVRIPRSTVELKPLITTVSYCALYHYDKGKQHHPDEMKKVFKLSDKQYEWAVISPLASQQRWTDIQELLTSVNWMRKKTDVSHIGFEYVTMVLHKANAGDDVVSRYAHLIASLDMRVKYAGRLLLHDVVIDALVQLRDRQGMEEYRNKIGDTSRRHQQKVNDLLHNSSIKWR